MKKPLAFLFFGLLSFFSIAQMTGSFDLEPSQSNCEWTGSAAVGSYTLTGSVSVSSGSLTIDENTITACSLIFDLTTLAHEEKSLVDHLKSKDFYQVKKFPEATFTLSESAIISDGYVAVKGMLTIKGTSKEEQFDVTLTMDGERISCIFDCTVNRIDYGVNHNSPSLFDDLKDQAIADEFQFRGELSFVLAE